MTDNTEATAAQQDVDNAQTENNVNEATTTQTVGSETKNTQALDPAEVDRIATKRSEQGKRAAILDYFKQQGLTPEEAQKAFAQYKEAEQAKASEERNNLSSLQNKVDALEREKQEITEVANMRLVRGSALAKAAQMSIRPDRVEQAIRLADLTKVTVDESGNVDDGALTDALEQVTKDMPELLSTSDDSGAVGFKVGAPDQDKSASTDQISKIFGNA